VIAIEKPDGSGQAQQLLALTNQAISTSGSYRNYHEIDGKRYSHTIDPSTGAPNYTSWGVGECDCGGWKYHHVPMRWQPHLMYWGRKKGLALAQEHHIPAGFIDSYRERPPVCSTLRALKAWLPKGAVRAILC
jgi:thiamine biosynthesis lipoprotein